MDKDTVAYYCQHAAAFAAETLEVDMSALYAEFLPLLPEQAHILDAGCGSARDSLAFAQMGFRVTACDASPALAALAEERHGIPVEVVEFAALPWKDRFDGIWACASLLHVPEAELPAVLSRLCQALKVDGVLYLSFKYGQGERNSDGRHFTDLDETGLARLLAGQPSLSTIKTWLTADQRPQRARQQWLNALVRKMRIKTSHNLTTGGADDPLLPRLLKEINRASEIELAVAFIKSSGLSLLFSALQDALENRDTELRVITSDYLDVTDPQALRMLMLLQERGADIRIYQCDSASFHLKSYIFLQIEGDQWVQGSAWVGSSNISRAALTDGLEWNYRVKFPQAGNSMAGQCFAEIRAKFTALFSDPRVRQLDYSWIEGYERRRTVVPMRVAPGSDDAELPPPQPQGVQSEALSALRDSRQQGFRRGLVVMATGLGKTYLAAFDAQQLNAKRVLFVAHREEILLQAEKTFLSIWPKARVGHYSGKHKDADVDLLFASIQTLGQEHHLDRFPANHFDYLVVDEFHHAAASSYRRLLQHFKPRFLLGLTATPERTDQSDILSFCDDNLVYTCNLFEGIDQQLLCPFSYYGIFDQQVDYREIPWRNGRFDPEQLSHKLATLARARHALTEWQDKGLQRTLAFCVSIAHAEFMATRFCGWGVKAVAVYAGSSLRRADALQQLNAGAISVIFSVDLFNEGVDLPSIDTVMMLRPTESKVLFLQQLGRGLRRHDGKERLVVLDFIGNHKGFLNKPQALFKVASNYRALAAFARQLEQDALSLPDGCFVNYDLAIIDFLKQLDGDGISQDYQALQTSLGRRPTLVELYRAGVAMTQLRRQYGCWWQMVAEFNELTPAEQACLARHQDWFSELETTAMTKSFKMVLIESLLEHDGFLQPPTVAALSGHALDVFQRRRPLVADIASSHRDIDQLSAKRWQQYWQGNPIKAWLGGNRGGDAKRWFELRDGRFSATFTVTEQEFDTFSAMVQELVDYRLAAYTDRAGLDTSATASTAVTADLPAASQGTELTYFPDLRIACGHFRTGSAEADEYRTLESGYGRLDPARHFIARASGNSMNGGKQPIVDGDYLLLEQVAPGSAGSITGTTMAIERQDAAGDNQYLLRTVSKSADGRYILKASNPDYADLEADDSMRTFARLRGVIDPLDIAVGQDFMRQDIPPLFGHDFNPGNWQSGHVVLKDPHAHILLVTLNKQGKAREQRYLDYFIDERTFHWQSQNSVSPASSKGEALINHQAKGVDVHLFVRENKLTGGKAAPFHYYGKVHYLRHQGSQPMSVEWALEQR